MYQRTQAMHRIEAATRNGESSTEIAQNYKANGILNENDVALARHNARQSYLRNGIELMSRSQRDPALRVEDALKVFEKGTPEEQYDMRPALSKMREAIYTIRDPKERARIRDLYQKDVQAAFGH
jgi:16S rRNA G966 N2-methylase RsmD